jgi:hypothetical protein
VTGATADDGSRKGIARGKYRAGEMKKQRRDVLVSDVQVNIHTMRVR